MAIFCFLNYTHDTFLEVTFDFHYFEYDVSMGLLVDAELASLSKRQTTVFKVTDEWKCS